MTSRPLSVPLTPGSPEWHAWRLTGIGSSDIAVITGDAPWGDPVTLYQEKLGYAAGRVQTASMEAGQWLEDLVARWWAKETGRRAWRINRGLRSRSHEFAIASPDRGIPGGLLEVKIADHPGDAWGEPGSADIPDHYFEQVQWQAHVADVDVVELAVFFTRTRRRTRYTVPRDPGTVEELLEYGAAFWRCVQERRAPEPLERALRLPLRADEIEADEELGAFVRRYEAAKADVDAMTEELEEAKNLIRAKLADVGGARGDGFRVAYRPNADSTVTNWQAVALDYRQKLQLAADYQDDDLDAVVDDLTSTKPGARPLVVRRPKEKQRVAA